MAGRFARDLLVLIVITATALFAWPYVHEYASVIRIGAPAELARVLLVGFGAKLRDLFATEPKMRAVPVWGPEVDE